MARDAEICEFQKTIPLKKRRLQTVSEDSLNESAKISENDGVHIQRKMFQ